MNLFIIALTTGLATATLYLPQPLLPALSAELAVSQSNAALLMTVTLLPLALMPLGYGLLLESVSIKKVMRLATLGLALSNGLIFYVEAFPLLIVLRFFQGFMIPALLTCAMTLISKTTSAPTMQKAMSFYIACTIFGGASGRSVSGWVASNASWQYSFLVFAIGSFLCLLLQTQIQSNITLDLATPRKAILWAVLKDKRYQKLYLIIFCTFFVFSSVLNFIPFRLAEIDPMVSEFTIGLVYSGYYFAMITAIFSRHIIQFLVEEINVILLCVPLLVGALFFFASDTMSIVFVTMFLFCALQFLINSVVSGSLNQMAQEFQGVVNGLYITIYYIGGVLGSYLPGLIYQHQGWNRFILFQTGMLALGMTTALFYKKRHSLNFKKRH